MCRRGRLVCRMCLGMRWRVLSHDETTVVVRTPISTDWVLPLYTNPTGTPHHKMQKKFSFHPNNNNKKITYRPCKREGVIEVCADL